jgi:hypothetical protein
MILLVFKLISSGIKPWRVFHSGSNKLVFKDFIPDTSAVVAVLANTSAHW